MYNAGDFGDDENFEDEFFEEGEEYLERRWMQEQREMEIALDEDSKSESGTEGVWRGLYAIWKAQGFRGWYRGLTVSLIKAAPASAVTMYVYEQTLHSLMTTGKNDEIWEMYTAYDDLDED